MNYLKCLSFALSPLLWTNLQLHSLFTSSWIVLNGAIIQGWLCWQVLHSLFISFTLISPDAKLHIHKYTNTNTQIDTRTNTQIQVQSLTGVTFIVHFFHSDLSWCKTAHCHWVLLIAQIHKYTSTWIQIHKYKFKAWQVLHSLFSSFTDLSWSEKMHTVTEFCKHTSTNTQIQIHKYKYTNTNIQIQVQSLTGVTFIVQFF